MTTFVVERAAKGNWTVTNSNGELVAGGFKNWPLAEELARTLAIEAEGFVLRIGAKTGNVEAHFKPRIVTPHHLVAKRNAGIESSVPVTTPTVEDEVVEPAPTEAELNALPTPALVAAYNAVGGNITGKYKGSRAKLVEKILAANAS